MSILALALSNRANKSWRSSFVSSKKDRTCRRGITRVCPGETGKPSRMTTPLALRATTRLVGRLQKGHSLLTNVGTRDQIGCVRPIHRDGHRRIVVLGTRIIYCVGGLERPRRPSVHPTGLCPPTPTRIRKTRLRGLAVAQVQRVM